jgi:hypothetical protein
MIGCTAGNVSGGPRMLRDCLYLPCLIEGACQAGHDRTTRAVSRIRHVTLEVREEKAIGAQTKERPSSILRWILPRGMSELRSSSARGLPQGFIQRAPSLLLLSTFEAARSGLHARVCPPLPSTPTTCSFDPEEPPVAFSASFLSVSVERASADIPPLF